MKQKIWGSIEDLNVHRVILMVIVYSIALYIVIGQYNLTVVGQILQPIKGFVPDP